MISKFLLKEAVRFTKVHWSKSEREFCTAMNDRDLYEIRTESDASYFGLKWKGKPFIYMPGSPLGYDTFDHFLSWISGLHYILSGDWTRDRCEAADQDMLENAW